MKKIHISDLAKVKEVRNHYFFNDFSLGELQDVEVMHAFLYNEIYDEVDYLGDGFFMVS